MESKHTPGPWRRQSPLSITIVAGNGTYVCRTNRDNARLIAAAPDLLTAARLAFGGLATGEYGYEELKAAIEKATA